MNSVKRAYVSLFLTAMTGTLLYALWQLLFTTFSLGWLGVILASAPILVMLGRAFLLTNMARTSQKLPTITLLGLVGIVLASIDTYQTGQWLTAIWATACFAGFQAYNFWYSDLEREQSQQLLEGQKLPAFTVYDAHGKAFSSADLEGSPALIMFYRGNWCPLCVAQIKEIAADYRRMADQGIQVLLISPQPEEHTRSLAEKFNVPFKFLVDKDNQAAEKLCIAMKDGLPMGLEVLGYDTDTVFPTTIATNARNVIIYSDQTSNYRVRPEPEDYMGVFTANGALS